MSGGLFGIGLIARIARVQTLTGIASVLDLSNFPAGSRVVSERRAIIPID